MATKKVDRSKLPMTEPPFKGKIGRTYKESKAEWPQLPKAPKAAPIGASKGFRTAKSEKTLIPE